MYKHCMGIIYYELYMTMAMLLAKPFYGQQIGFVSTTPISLIKPDQVVMYHKSLPNGELTKRYVTFHPLFFLTKKPVRGNPLFGRVKTPFGRVKTPLQKLSFFKHPNTNHHQPTIRFSIGSSHIPQLTSGKHDRNSGCKSKDLQPLRYCRVPLSSAFDHEVQGAPLITMGKSFSMLTWLKSSV